MQAVKTTPHIKQGEGATLVPGTVILLHQKRKIKINGNQEGCGLDLKSSLMRVDAGMNIGKSRQALTNTSYIK